MDIIYLIYFIYLVFIALFISFLFFAKRVFSSLKETQDPKKINKYCIGFGIAWSLVSFLPYLIMVGGRVSLPIFISLATFPVWVTIELSDFLYNNFSFLYDIVDTPPFYLFFSILIGSLIGGLAARLIIRLKKI